MKIESNELRKEINKLHSEMGFVSKADIARVIDELEEKARSESEFYQILDTL
jgi:hypothetical protein